MLKIDSHHHFWKYNPDRDIWIDNSMSVLKKDFLPEDLLPLLLKHGFNGSIVVQSDQSLEENMFQLKNASHYPFIKGIVGWVDLQAVNLTTTLVELKSYEKLKGFRHILQVEKDRALLLTPTFMRGIKELSKLGYTYDLLILPDQLKYAEELVAACPDQWFMLDHLGKPDIKNQNIQSWTKGIKALAKHENVYCKASGLVTEADVKHWKEDDFIPYLDVLFDAFGSNRVLFGSDWPVCKLAATYDQVIAIMKNYTSTFSVREQEQFWGGNAQKFYKLNT